MKKFLKSAICILLAVITVSMCACNTVEDEESTQPVTEATEQPTEATPPARIVSAFVLKNKKTKNAYITAEDIEAVEVAEDQLPEDYITKKTQVIGKWAAEDLPADTYLGASMILTESPAKKEDSKKDPSVSELGYLVITEYVKPNTGLDVSTAIQKVIDDNPNRTIFFPDGEYILGKPIATSANPVNSVSLHLSNYAVLKAAKGWNHTEAMVRMGGAEPYNSITINGSNYYFYGGIIDGSGVANGISIDSGRETSIRNVSIKNTYIGLHIKSGANNRSSDADIDTVNIVGNNKAGSIGAYIVGFDNTLTNMRIANVQTGVKLEGAGNFMRNLHPLMTYGGMEYAYEDSIGFDDLSGGNWYDFCYSDQFAVGFQMAGGTLSTYQTCFCFWYQKDSMQVGFKSTGKFNSTIWNSKVNLTHKDILSAYIDVATTGGGGRIECPIFDKNCDTLGTYKSYMLLGDTVMWPK